MSVEAELDDLVLFSAAVPDGVAVAVDVVLESLPDALTVHGTVRAPWRGECRRCLRVVSAEVTTEVREVFEAHPVEGETYPLDGDHVDLEPMVRDAVLLALPLAPLCDEVCPGPAPGLFTVRGGVDHAARAGTGPGEGGPAERAAAPAADPCWAALDDLRFD